MKFLLTVILLASSLAANAEKSNISVCNELQELGYKIMELRQSGVPVSTVMGASDGNKTINSIIIAAYEEMQYSTKEYQIRASREFANKVYIECFKAASRK